MKQGGKAIWKPEVVLLCYDRHENVKQIKIESDSSDSSEDESINREAEQTSCHREIAGQTDQSAEVDLSRQIPHRLIHHMHVANCRFICAVVVVAIAIIVAVILFS